MIQTRSCWRRSCASEIVSMAEGSLRGNGGELVDMVVIDKADGLELDVSSLAVEDAED